jgi:hypothetical protein
VVAALNLGTLTTRFQLHRDEIITAVKDAAAEVSGRFGFGGKRGISSKATLVASTADP